MGNLRFEVIKSGKRILSVNTRMLMNFINEFIDENAPIIYDKKISLKDEKEFQKLKAKEIDGKRTIFVLCWDGKKLVGNSSASLEPHKQSHNATFGLVVRKGYRGIGVGEKLLSMGIKQAKGHLKAKYLWLDYIEGNKPARKLYEKLGFKEVARLEGYVKHKGKHVDKIIMKYAK